MCFQCDEKAVHLVRCTGSKRWTKHKPLRNDTVLLWMGTSQDSHCQWTVGCIPAWLNCLFVVEDAESSVHGLLALVQTFGTEPICQTASMLIVEERHQPPMQSLHEGSCSCKPVFGVGNTYIVPISVIQGAAHLPPLPPQPDSSRWYLSNTTDLNAFNLFHINSITSAKKYSIRGEWLRKSGHTPPELSRTPWWWNSPPPASIQRVPWYLALR